MKRRIALVSSEPIRQAMAGIGIRYLMLARGLAGEGFDVTLAHPGSSEARPALAEGVALVELRRGALASQLAGVEAVVAQGPLANDVLLELPNVPTAIDLYDPWLVENLAYAQSLGEGVYRNDHATWSLQLDRGDFFLCSSEEQRTYYLGFLTALGRVGPAQYARDTDYRSLVDVVPFFVPETLPPHEPVLPPRLAGERRILFGGLYDWLDPWPVLHAFADHAEPGWRLLFVANPNPETTPRGLAGEVQAWCRERDLWGDRVRMVGWVPTERRFDLLRDVDVMVATHRPSLETRLSLRTRFLDALAAGLPVIATTGGALSDQLAREGAGRVVPAGDTDAVARAIADTLANPADSVARAAGQRIVERHHWANAVRPLLDFLADPRCDDSPRSIADPAGPSRTDAAVARHAFHRIAARLRRAAGGGR